MTRAAPCSPGIQLQAKTRRTKVPAVDEILIALLLLFVGGRKKKATPMQGPVRQRPTPPKGLAMLYRLPADSYETTRVAVQEPGQTMRKRGIFTTPKAAWELVVTNGWKAEPTVQQLEADPPEAAQK